MGSFHTDCGISGLPIRSEDPVRFALIQRREYSSNSTCYPYCHYRFLTPLFESTYNDYGSVEEKDIKKKDVFKAVIKAISPNTPTIETFLGKLREKESKEVYLWMAHGWAVDFVLAIEREEREQEFRSMEVRRIGNWGDPAADLDLRSEWPRALSLGFYEMVRMLPSKYLDVVKEMAIETNDLGLKLEEIRKQIQPNTTIGEPHWESPALIPWTKLVAEKAGQQFVSEDDD